MADTKKPAGKPENQNRMNSKQKAALAHNIIQSAQKGLAEARETLRRDDAQRTADQQKLLHPTEILNGTHDAGDVWRRLMTTRGGHIRPITVDDLKDFERLATQLGKKYQKGITAKGVIDNSLAADRDRAKAQIHTAIPIASKAGSIKFATNTGPDSDRERQYVMVQMVDFEKMVVQPDTPARIAAALTRGHVAVSCTCGRWRFWYAYMATIGGYNANPEHREAAFPKIRNPSLRGLACKHILRVMAVFSQTNTAKAYIARMVEREQTKVKAVLARERQQEMHEFAEQLHREDTRKHHIKTTDEKRIARMPKSEQAKAKAVAREVEKARKQQARVIDKTKAAAIANIQKLLAAGAISQDQFDTMVKTLG
jgi:hypothetical protein